MARGLLLATVTVILLGIITTAFAIEQEGDVYVLTTSAFNDFVDTEDISLVEFYAPWCGHCKNLAPEYAKAATALKPNGVKLAKVDATVESDLASRFGVTGYPTMKIFRKGSASEYKGPRDAAGIVSFMQKQAAPSITVFKTVQDLEKFVQDDAAVVFFGESSGKAYKAFEQLAEKQRETFRFGKTDVKEVLEHFGHNKDEVVLIQAKRYSQSPLEEKEVVHKEGDLLAWVNKHILPLVGELTNDNQALYNNKDLPIVKIYSDLNWGLDAKGANYLLNKIRKVAKEYADKFVFAVAGKGKNQKEIDDFGLPKGENPFVIHNVKKNHKFPAADLFSGESLKAHLESFLANKLEPYVKSEPVPESQPEGEPVVVVGKNFEDIVLDSTKDVLLEAYAPWCGHCKSLEPKYKELAQKMSKYSDSLTIAKVDATANDLPPKFQVTGFPTIFFIPANKKDSPLKYDGQREVADFTNYIKKHASIPLKAKENKTKGDKEEL